MLMAPVLQGHPARLLPGPQVVVRAPATLERGRACVPDGCGCGSRPAAGTPSQLATLPGRLAVVGAGVGRGPAPTTSLEPVESSRLADGLHLEVEAGTTADGLASTSACTSTWRAAL
ncbi:MAG TPA: hypothetical protein VJ914_40240 [Pseudonocardiaceae bacterium]|nr:hypothetical protein [Pseudonocardiaceae bacterium]